MVRRRTIALVSSPSGQFASRNRWIQPKRVEQSPRSRPAPGIKPQVRRSEPISVDAQQGRVATICGGPPAQPATFKIWAAEADRGHMPFGESFEGVLTAAQEGAEWAWSSIYAEFGGPLTGYLTVRGAREPEDLVGDVFLQVARNVGTFTGNEANFRSWLFMVAHHRLIDERRRRARRKEEPVAHDDLAGIAGGPDAEQAALAGLADESLRYLLEQLTPDQRDVVALRIIAGLTLEETAAATGKKVGAVTQLQRRGLASLRRILDPQPITP